MKSPFQMSLSLCLDTRRKCPFIWRRDGVVLCAAFVMRVVARGGERRRAIEELGRREREKQKK